ncbi:probable endoglucanase [Rhynchosporium secalis]|uniref:Probable endoglucanase n=1 Tax=Rhynchosporium secalis TaxID=38038 RepID=A0A1E1MQK6_RHYSE|nr:probable endoglucanase [Rhynchosporium secalis]
MFLLQGAAILAAGLLSGSVEAVASQAFTWKNVKIGGGGGFVPGIVFNPSLKGLAYARTDIGGAYRLNADDSWTPLMDSTNNSNWHNWGVDAIATDPVDTGRVYAAVGMYTNEWDPENGSILRSTDQGNTWAATKLPFKVGGNMPGRGVGERLAIDPNSNNIIYFGARSGNGLYKSTDFGVTFSKVAAFKWPGTYFQATTSSYTSDPVGIAWITFDTTTGTKGSATPRIFVGVVDVGQSVFKSEDGGVTWAWVAGEPQLGFIPHKGVLSPAEKVLYISYANAAGPYDGSNGTLHKYNLTSGAWTDISPVSVATTTYGYGGLAVDLKNPGTIMVAALNSWWPDGQIWRSTNGGVKWSPIWEFSGYPAMNRYYGYDVSLAPWLQDQTFPKEFPQNVGWMMECLVIDPFDSNHWLYGTGATIYGGHDLLSWDTKHNVTLKSLANGIEETYVRTLIVAPGGPTLLSAIGDVGGFTHKDLDVAPDQAWHTPSYGTTVDLDYAGNKPSNLVRTGESTTEIGVAVSSDYASTWKAYSGASLSTGPGKVAISADADTILMMATSGAVISKNSAAFSVVQTLPLGSAIASDKRNNTYFYGASASSAYVSSNGGTTFVKTATLGSSKVVSQVRVHPNVAGDVWISTDVGLFHSTDFGSTFTQIASDVTAAWNFALGAGATKSAYPAIYGFFTIGGTTALFKTEDAGVTWFIISDAKNGFGAVGGNTVGADTENYGKVYVGTNGRGIFYGVASGKLPPSPTSASSTSKPTSNPSSPTSSKPPTVTSTKKSSTASSAPAPTGAAPAGPYQQCGGGPSYTGPTTCVAGWKCTFANAFYSQCSQ